MGRPSADWFDDDALLAASLALSPASPVGMQAVSAASFMRANADYVCGWKDAGLTFGRIAAKLTEMGMKAEPRHVRRILAEVRKTADPKRAQAVARAIGVELMRRSVGVPNNAAPPPAPVVSRPHVPTAMPASSGEAPGAQSRPESAPPAASSEKLPKPTRPARPTRPAFIESESPLAPIGLKPVESAAMAELTPIPGEDGDVCHDLTNAGKPMSFGEMRRSLWADVRGPSRSNYATGASGVRVFVLPQIQRDIFTGRISNWIEFKAALDGI